MKISQNQSLETPLCVNDDNDDNENIQLDIHEEVQEKMQEPIKKKRVYVKKVKDVKPEPPVDDLGQDSINAPKPKRKPTEKQLLNWARCLEARKASCER